MAQRRKKAGSKFKQDTEEETNNWRGQDTNIGDDRKKGRQTEICWQITGIPCERINIHFPSLDIPPQHQLRICYRILILLKWDF